MDIEEIHSLWKDDCNIDRTELGEESLRIPQLHSKYFNIFSRERTTLRKYETVYKKLYKLKYQYYVGSISEEELKQSGWEPFPVRLLKADVPIYMDADKELSEAKTVIDGQREKVELLEAIIKSLPTRGYQIKAAIEWEKFRNGL